MKSISLLVLACLAYTALASGEICTVSRYPLSPRIVWNFSEYYEKGHGEYGHNKHDLDHKHYYDVGHKKGFDKGGYGDYGSYKYGGWKSYAKGKEHGSEYGISSHIFSLWVSMKGFLHFNLNAPSLLRAVQSISAIAAAVV